MWMKALEPLSDETLKSIAVGEAFVIQVDGAPAKTNDVAAFAATRLLFNRAEILAMRLVRGPEYASSITMHFTVKKTSDLNRNAITD